MSLYHVHAWRVLGPLEQMVVSWCVGAGNQTIVFWKSSHCSQLLCHLSRPSEQIQWHRPEIHHYHPNQPAMKSKIYFFSFSFMIGSHVV